MTSMTLLLSRDDLGALLDLDEVIGAVERAFAAYSTGGTVTPARGVVRPPGTDGVLLAMPCAVAEPPALGTKVVSVYSGNAARGLPTVTSLYLLSDYESGAPLAVMDGTLLTAVRTAAGSAVATKYLARPEVATLGVFGTGVQARAHVRALCRVRAFTRVLVAATSPEKGAAFAQWVDTAVGVRAKPSTHEAASSADVLAVCTTSPVPVVVADRVRGGAHVNAVGAFTPATRELPADLIGAARVYVDTRAGASTEAGDLLIPVQEGRFALERVVGDLGDVIVGRVEGRSAVDDVTLYKSVGAAFLDAATARLAYERAVERGVGQQFRFA